SAGICRDAAAALGRTGSIRVLKMSSLYRSRPVGGMRQDWFVNGVVSCQTDLDPLALLDHMLEVEREFGRERHEPWGPRTLDLDLLFYGQRQITHPRLMVPHPRMDQRLFVLVPLAEIAPDWLHPGRKLTARQLLEDLWKQEHDQVVRPLAGRS
nr:2-amino-4-hydroxy-6-hydroxymethyldihydropteridine diphosphokinase [Syntrophobacteraceae bacterium]